MFGKRKKNKIIEENIIQQSSSINEINQSAINGAISAAMNSLKMLSDEGNFEKSYTSSDGNQKVVIKQKTVTKSNGIMPDGFDEIFNVFMPNIMNANHQQEEVIKCKGCGANNKIIVGKITKCEFCRSLLDNED